MEDSGNGGEPYRRSRDGCRKAAMAAAWSAGSKGSFLYAALRSALNITQSPPLARGRFDIWAIFHRDTR